MHRPLAFAMIQMRGVPPSLPVPGRPPLTWTASTPLRGPFFLPANERSTVAGADPLAPYGHRAAMIAGPSNTPLPSAICRANNMVGTITKHASTRVKHSGARTGDRLPPIAARRL
jgi:hypothetical protein